MTLIISKGLTLASANNGITDPDAIIYINRVEQADGQNLEPAVAQAIHALVVELKAGGLWNSINVCHSYAAARTLAGALVPLKGPAPVNVNFVSGDYVRASGLAGDGSTKIIDTTIAANTYPQDSVHLSVFVSAPGTTTSQRVLTGNAIAAGSTSIFTLLTTALNSRCRTSANSAIAGEATTVGFKGISRSASADFTMRSSGSSSTFTVASVAPEAGVIGVFGEPGGARRWDGTARFHTSGTSLNLAALQTVVDAYMSNLSAAGI